MRTPDSEPNDRLRTLRSNIDALIERLGGKYEPCIRSASKTCKNAPQLRLAITLALAACGYGRADVGPIADAALDGVAAALADDERSTRFKIPKGSAALYHLRSFEVAVVGSLHRGELLPTTSDALPVPSGVGVALRGARRMLLPDGGEVVRFRFSTVTELVER